MEGTYTFIFGEKCRHVIETLTSEWIRLYFDMYASKKEKKAFENMSCSLGNKPGLPLPFWFVRDKHYLSLQNLEYDDAVLKVTLRPLNECYCVRKKDA